MVALIFSVAGLLGLSRAFVFPGSHETDACITNNDVLNCTCKNRENVPMSASLNFYINIIQVSGCGVVTVPFGAAPQLELEEILFTDIHQLDIRPFAFIGTQTIQKLKIQDIGHLNVDSHGFVGLLNVVDIVIKNVSSMSLQEGAFGGISTVEHFLIEDSNLGVIKNGVFILTNITMFRVSDSKIGAVESNAFIFHKVRLVTFDNCSIEKASNRSLTMAYVDSLVFSGCNFGILDSSSIQIMLSGSFSFVACAVRKLDTYAIIATDMIGDITFINNVIHSSQGRPLYLGSENSSAETLRTEDTDVNACCNSFLCDCDLHWMWSEEELFYDFNTSFCIGTETKLSDVVPLLDSAGKCTTLKRREYTGKECNKTTSSSAGIERSRQGLRDSSQHSRSAGRGNSLRVILAGTILKIPFICLAILYGLSAVTRLG